MHLKIKLNIRLVCFFYYFVFSLLTACNSFKDITKTKNDNDVVLHWSVVFDKTVTSEEKKKGFQEAESYIRDYAKDSLRVSSFTIKFFKSNTDLSNTPQDVYNIIINGNSKTDEDWRATVSIPIPTPPKPPGVMPGMRYVENSELKKLFTTHI